MGSFVAGILALIVLETLVTSKVAQGNLGKTAAIANGITRWVIDPTVPGCPMLKKTATPTTTKGGK